MVAARRPAVHRGEVWLVTLDPTVGHEIRKTRPCVIVSPDEMNAHLATALVAPLTTGGFDAPTRVTCTFQGKSGRIVLDQVRAVDQVRLQKRLGALEGETLTLVLAVLGEMFAV